MCMNFHFMITLLAFLNVMLLSTHVSSIGSILHHSHHYCFFLTGCSILTCTLQLYVLSTNILDFDWHYLCWRLWIAFSTVTVLLTGQLRKCVLILGRGIVIFSPEHPDWLWDKSILLFNEYWWFENDNFLPSSTKAKNKWMYTFVPPICLLGMHGMGQLYVYCLFLNLLLVRTLPGIFCP